MTMSWKCTILTLLSYCAILQGAIIGPVIEQCGDSPLPPAAVCSLKASRRKSKVDLDCRLGGFTGNATLIWSSSEKPTIPSHRHTNQLPDGSVVLVATISVDAKEEFEQTLTCSAEGDDIAGYPSATVTILAMKAGLSTGVWVFIALLAVIIVVAISMVVTLVVLRIRSKLRRPRARSHEAIPLVGIDQRRQSIRKDMQDYDGGNVNIKIYGRRGSGKSALINSMNFALSGVYSNLANEGDSRPEKDAAEEPRHSKLTEYITLIEHRAMADYSDLDLTGNAANGGVGALRTHQDETNVVIFVCDYPSTFKDEDQALSIRKVVDKLREIYVCLPMIVLTHKDVCQDTANLKSDLKLATGGQLWEFENYTELAHTEDVERDLQFLQLLSASVESFEQTRVQH